MSDSGAQSTLPNLGPPRWGAWRLPAERDDSLLRVSALHRVPLYVTSPLDHHIGIPSPELAMELSSVSFPSDPLKYAIRLLDTPDGRARWTDSRQICGASRSQFFTEHALIHGASRDWRAVEAERRKNEKTEKRKKKGTEEVKEKPQVPSSATQYEASHPPSQQSDERSQIRMSTSPAESSQPPDGSQAFPKDEAPGLPSKFRCLRCKKNKKGCDGELVRPCTVCREAGLSISDCVMELKARWAKKPRGVSLPGPRLFSPTSPKTPAPLSPETNADAGADENEHIIGSLEPDDQASTPKHRWASVDPNMGDTIDHVTEHENDSQNQPTATPVISKADRPSPPTDRVRRKQPPPLTRQNRSDSFEDDLLATPPEGSERALTLRVLSRLERIIEEIAEREDKIERSEKKAERRENTADTPKTQKRKKEDDDEESDAAKESKTGKRLRLRES